MINIILISFGTGLGGVSRYLMSTYVYRLLGQQFPYGTLIVNAIGSLLIGFLSVIIIDRYPIIGPQLRAFLLIGFIGGYTTFSTFSLETLTLFENGDWIIGILNILLSIGLCLSLTWLGIVGARQL